MNESIQTSRRRCLHSLTLAVTGLGQPRLVRAALTGGDLAKTADGEPTLWEKQRPTAEAAFDFWKGFLAFRMGTGNDKELDQTCRAKYLCIIRAVSWVESKHTSVDGSSHGSLDPMQCGNPSDIWWKELTGQLEATDRFVGGPGAGNYDADELPNTVKGSAKFPDAAKLSKLAMQKKGHDDPGFSPTMSYYWGIIYLVHKINTQADLGGSARTYKCGDCSMSRLQKGAIAYNGGGDPKYGKKIVDALTLIGCS